MSASIRILTEPPQTIAATMGETILTNALQAGISFPHNCQSGNCGACKCELVDGDVLELPYSEYALSAEERSRNLILACRAQIWGDCTVRLLEAEEVVLHPSRVMRCRVETITDLTHDIKGLGLSILEGGPYTFTAGQHARLKFGPGIPERNYSMANHLADDVLEFHVRAVPRGQASGYVFTNLHAGSEVKVSGPLGNAYLRENHAGPILAVAGGSGMAPIKSICDAALRTDPNRKIHLYFGVRDERDIYLEDYWRERAARHPNFSFEIVLSQPMQQSSRRKGMIRDAVAADFPSFDGYKTYVAGPPPMVEAVQALLLERGMALRDIHADAFYSQADDAFNLS